MYYYEMEIIANLRKNETEKAAQNAWMFTTPKKESTLQEYIRKITRKSEKKNEQIEPCFVACC